MDAYGNCFHVAYHEVIIAGLTTGVETVLLTINFVMYNFMCSYTNNTTLYCAEPQKQGKWGARVGPLHLESAVDVLLQKAAQLHALARL